MSMIAICDSVSTIFCSSDSMTIWVRAESRVPIIGRARMPSHNLTTGVDSSRSSVCWRPMTSSRDIWKVLIVCKPSLSSSSEATHVSWASLSASLPHSCLNASKIGRFREKIKVAVSSEENPASTRCRDRSSRNARTGCHPAAPMSSAPCARAVAARTFRNSSACFATSLVDKRPFAEADACSSCCSQLPSISLRRVCSADTSVPFEAMTVSPLNRSSDNYTSEQLCTNYRSREQSICNAEILERFVKNTNSRGVLMGVLRPVYAARVAATFRIVSVDVRNLR